MTAGKGIARSYLAQLAEPVPQGEPVFTARRGAHSGARELPVEAPVIEDVIESREALRSSRPSRVVRRKAGAASAHAKQMPETVQTDDSADAGAASAGVGEQRVSPAIQPQETGRKQEGGGHPNATVVQSAAVPRSSHINRVSPRMEETEVRSAEPIDSNAERRYERLKGAEKATKLVVEDVVSDARTGNAEPVHRESSIRPVTSTRYTVSQHADKQGVRVEQVFRPVMQSGVRPAKEPRLAEARTAAADEPSRNERTLPREFVATAGGKKTGVSVRIGTIEVRISSPPPQPAQAATQAMNEAQSKPAESHLGPRPTSRESLSSGLAWQYGLIQG